MGTHPIFESDFDCLTAFRMLTKILLPVRGMTITRINKLNLNLIRSKYSSILDTQDASKKWSAVEDILPPIQIPTPNLNQSFPTPSGWQPPQPEKIIDLDYVVRRNRFHEFEILEEERASEFYDLNYDNRYEDKYDKMLRNRDQSLDIPLTHLSNCSGDIFKLRDDLVEFLESVSNEPLAGRADEIEGRITVTGKFYDFVEDFLYERGF